MVVTRNQIRNREVDQHKKQRNKKKKVSVVRRCSSSREEEVKGNNEFNKLSADVVTSIFLRCPEKVLSMLRCTSKAWNNFIMTPSFLHSHFTQSMQNGPLLLYLQLTSLHQSGHSMLQFVSVDMEGNIEELFTVTAPDTQLAIASWCACSGLVCLFTGCRIYLCNPLLHQLRVLPNCSPSATMGYHLFGIGYLPSRKVYKVVHFFYKGPQVHPLNLLLAQLRCEVFTLNRDASCHNIHNRWKETAEMPPCHPLSPGLSVNESIYWFANVRVAPPDRILSFDVESGNFLTISRPSSVTRCGTCMMDLEGMLCLPDIDRFLKTNSILDLWILKDKISSTWVKEYSINLDTFRPERFAYPYFRSWNDVIVFPHSDMVVFYDLKRKCFRQVKQPKGSLRYAMYSKSLFSLGEI